MTKENYTTMVLLEVNCCLLLLILSCFPAKADPVEIHDAPSAVDEVNSVPKCRGGPLFEAKSTQRACFISAIGRGAGAPLDACPAGKQRRGELCYSPCRGNYHAVGPVCMESCSSGFTDTGVLCIHSYGKGCCCTIFGCCGCPVGYKDDGCFCRQSYVKKSYGQGMGVPLVCGPGKVKDGALCYPSCPYGYRGEGPVCWQDQQRSAQFPIKCNDFVWAMDGATCSKVRQEFSDARVASEACLAVALVPTALEALEPLAVAVCSTSVGAATVAADKLVQLTGAHACPRSS